MFSLNGSFYQFYNMKNQMSAGDDIFLSSIATDGIHFYVIEETDNKLYQISSTGIVLKEAPLPNNPSNPCGLTYDGTKFWIYNYDDEFITFNAY